MSLLFRGLFRGAFLLACVACLSAVVLGRYAPRPASFRMLKSRHLEAINGYHFAASQRDPYVFDPDTGRIARLGFPSHDFLDCAAISPWEDEEGESQVVGRWVRHSTPRGLCEGYGLARYTFPGGVVLDRVLLDVMPTGRPCFIPGASAGVLFAAGDGRLYRFVFGEDGRGAATDEGTPAPTPLGWRVATAGRPPAGLNDPVWPTDERLGGRLLVSLTLERDSDDGRPAHQNQIWWLELNPERTEVIGAGRMIRPGGSNSEPDWEDEAQPNVTVTPDGGLALGFLTRRPGQSGWALRVAPIEFLSGTGIPTAREDAAVAMARGRAHTLPIFTGDGRWVYSLPRSENKPSQFERLALPPSILTPATSPSHVALRTAPKAWN